MSPSPSTQPQMPGRSPLDDIVFAARGTTKYTEADAMSTYTVAESFFSTDTRYSTDTTVAYKNYQAAHPPGDDLGDSGSDERREMHAQMETSDARSVRSFWVEPEPVHRYLTPDMARRPAQHTTRSFRGNDIRDGVQSTGSASNSRPATYRQHSHPERLQDEHADGWHYPRNIAREQYLVPNPNARTPSPRQGDLPCPGFFSQAQTRRSSSSGSGQHVSLSPKGLVRALSKSGKSMRPNEGNRHVSEPTADTSSFTKPKSGSGNKATRPAYETSYSGSSSPRTPNGRADLLDARHRSQLPRKDLIASLESLRLDEANRASRLDPARKSPSTLPLLPATYLGPGISSLAHGKNTEALQRPLMHQKSVSRKSVKPNRQVSLNDSAMASLPDNALTPENHVDLGIEQHEKNLLPQSTHHFRKAAEAGDPVGCLLYGLALRHGWGCRADVNRSLVYLEQAAQQASNTVNAAMRRSTMAGKNLGAELAVAMFEIGMSYQNGWGVLTDKKRAVEYFELASAWGDADAMIVLGDLYLRGDGCKKDKRKAAQMLRAAEAKGRRDVGNSWIYKDKYS